MPFTDTGVLDHAALEAFRADLNDAEVSQARATYAALLAKQAAWTAEAAPLPTVLIELVVAYGQAEAPEQATILTQYRDAQTRLDILAQLQLEAANVLPAVEVAYLAILHAHARVAARSTVVARRDRAEAARGACEYLAQALHGEHVRLDDSATWPGGAAYRTPSKRARPPVVQSA